VVTIDSVLQVGVDLYQLDWSSDQDISDANPYRIYQDGVLIATQTAASLVVQAPASQVPVFEILDDADAVPQPGYPAYSILSWTLDDDVSLYRIEEYDGAAWNEVATVSPDRTSSFQSWQSETLDDLSTTQYRVLGIDAAGNEGTPTTFTVFMVRHPDAPDVEMTFNTSPRTVTIAAA
jgi:hypothetical protein